MIPPEEHAEPHKEAEPQGPSRYDVISAAYEAAISPENYNNLVESWGAFLVDLVQSTEVHVDSQPSTDPRLDDPEIARHFHRAAQILRQTAINAHPERADDIVNANEHAALALSVAGRVTAANSVARHLFGAVDHLADLVSHFQADDGRRIRDMLAQTGRIGMAAPPTVALYGGTGEDAAHFVLSPVLLRGDDVPIVIMRALLPQWSQDLDGILAHVFALTPRERELVRNMCANASINEIAAREKRSPLTLRTQLKAIFGKTGVTSQVALVRLVAGLSALSPTVASGGVEVDTGGQVSISLPDGRLVYVHTHGPADGRPVVFVHGMLDGIGISRQTSDALFARNIRLIAPVRACFGRSDPVPDRRTAPERFAKDLDHVLTAMGVDQTVIVGHMAGSLYAFAAASILPQRITGVVSISGGIPIRSRQQFQIMSTRQKVMAITARYMPHLLPLLLNAGIAQIRSGGERRFMEALYKDAPQDMAVASRSDVFPILRDGYQFTVAQGSAAFETDAAHVTRDWTGYVRATSQPVLLVHGAHDPVVRIATVRLFASEFANIGLRELDECGQLVLYDRPHVVLDALEDILRQAGASQNQLGR